VLRRAPGGSPLPGGEDLGEGGRYTNFQWDGRSLSMNRVRKLLIINETFRTWFMVPMCIQFWMSKLPMTPGRNIQHSTSDLEGPLSVECWELNGECFLRFRGSMREFFGEFFSLGEKAAKRRCLKVHCASVCSSVLVAPAGG